MPTHVRPTLLVCAIAALLSALAFAQSGDVIISTNESWPAGEYHLNSLTVLSGATLTLQGANTTAKVGGQWAGYGVTIYAATVHVEAGARISADAQGYVGFNCVDYLWGAGPGGGPYNCNNWGNGGSYGGKGSGPNTNLMTTYGSSLTPTDLGSGGSGGFTWYHTGVGGNGGGAIRLIVSGTLTNDGLVSANGAGGGGPNVGESSGGGSGSGGSIYVTTAALTGAGIFQANGGQTVFQSSPLVTEMGGGGGRVADYYSDATGYTGFAASTATGGANTDPPNSGDGTIVFLDTSTASPRLYTWHWASLDPNAVATYESITVNNAGLLTIGGGANITVTGTLTVTGNSTVLFQSLNTTGLVNGQWQGTGAAVSAANVQVDAGSRLSADGQGYAGSGCGGPGAGPGGGPLNCNNAGNGGSYGGVGGGPNPAAIYGWQFSPTDLGSGGSGGFYAGLGGAGGGAIRLVVSGTITNNGVISANGSGASSNSGGGSGGSIYVTTPALAGSGSFTANGGSTGDVTGGGGGRIAICNQGIPASLRTNGARPMGAVGMTITANGGTGAAAGTIAGCAPSLRITADNQTMTYGGSTPSLTYSTNPSVSLDTPPTCVSSVNAASAVGTYAGAITCSGATSASYTITYAAGTMTINPAGLTVTAASFSRVYASPNPTFSGTIVGIHNDDRISAAYTTAATTSSSVGSYAIVPVLVDPDEKQGNYTVTQNNGTLIITQLTSSISLSASSNSAPLSTPVTFTATVSGSCTGNVTFTDAGVALSTAALDASGVATFTTAALAAGTHSISADYGGDTNCSASSTSVPLSFVVTALPDFGIAASTPALTMSAGESASAVITITPWNGFNHEVMLTASGAPPGATVTFSPVALTPDGSAVASTMTIHMAGSVARGRWPSPFITQAIGWVLFAFAPLCLRKRNWGNRRLPLVSLLMSLTTVVLVLCVFGCGGGFSIPPGPTPQTSVVPTTYNVVVTATSGGIQHSTTISLTMH